MFRARLLLLTVALAALAACGRRGDPLPPIVEVPETTTDLFVYQEQLDAVLTWSYPKLTRAGRTLADLGRIEVWRLDVPPGQESVGAGPQAEELRRQLMLGRGRLLARLEGEGLHAATRGAKLEFRNPLTPVTAGSVPSTLWYGVRSRRRDGTPSALSNIVAWKPKPVPPSVTETRADPGADGITLSWKGVPKGAYAVERREAAGGSWQLVSPVGLEATSFVDRTAQQGKTWQYRVRTVIELAASEPLPGISAPYPDVYPPPRPTSFICLPEPTQVRLRWDPSPEAGVKFEVSRRLAGGEWTAVGELVATTELMDAAAPAGELEYAARTVDAAGNASESAICTARTGL